MAFVAAQAFAQETQPQQTVAPPADAAASKPADASAAKPADAPTAPAVDAEHAVDKRVLGVLPNYRTINETGVYTPIDAKHKLIIATKDSFDYPLWGVAAAYAGLSQLENSDQSFGQGVKGYAHRLITNYADQAVGNMFSEGFMPALLHEDPRYRRLGAGRGGVGKRTWYALTRVMVTRTDSGGERFNFSEWGGNAIGVAFSNIWHPDSRDWSDNTVKLGEQVATDAISQVLKEFWPDIKQRFFHKKPPVTTD
jgi:hypothetical protein